MFLSCLNKFQLFGRRFQTNEVYSFIFSVAKFLHKLTECGGCAIILDSIILFFLQNWPESIVIIFFCCAVLAIKPDFKKIILMAAIQGLVNYVALLPISYGFHTGILTITLIVLIYMVTGASLPRIVFSVLLCLVVFIAVEIAILPLLLKAAGKSYLEVYNNPLLRAAFSLPQEISLLVLALLRYKLLGWKKNNDGQNCGKLPEEKSSSQ